MINTTHATERGFTIIETLVALSIFTFSILGLIVITSRGIADTNYTKNKLIAAYLAQEGIEMVRNMRDSGALGGNMLTDTTGGALSGCHVSGTQTGCNIDAATLAVETCSLALRSCGSLRYDSASGLYVMGSANPTLPETPFSRLITITDTSAFEAEITATVSWNQGATPRSVSTTETLFDWIRVGVPEE